VVFATSTVLNPNPAGSFDPTFDSKAQLRFQNDGHWHMVVVSWDDGYKKIYVDGGLAFSAQSPTASRFLGTDQPRYCYIGEGSETIQSFDDGTRARDYYMGDLASMHAWSTVFTDAQIEQMWRAQALSEMGGLGRCGTPTDLVFIIDETASISGAELKKAHEFAMRVVDNFVVDNVDPNADTRVGVVAYTSDARVAFDLGEHKTNGGVKVALDALPTAMDLRTSQANRYYDCFGSALKLATTQMSWRTGGVKKIIIWITDGMGSNSVSYCINKANRNSLLLAMRAAVDTVVPVGIRGSNGNMPEVDDNWLLSVSKGMPAATPFYSLDTYDNLKTEAIDASIAAGAACVTETPSAAPSVEPTNAPSASPTSAPTQAPTTTAPTKAPTFAPSLSPTFGGACTPGEAALCDGAQGVCYCDTALCAVKKCRCAVGYACSNDACGECTVAPSSAPTTAPTQVPSNAPTQVPTGAPTPGPTTEPTKVPTAAPTIWDGFAEGSDRVETQDGDLPQEAAIAGASIGAGVIALIIVAVCCAGTIVVAALLLGGVIVARKTMITLDRREVGGEIVTSTGVPRGTEFLPDPEWVQTRLELELHEVPNA
jgi:hypothetical protein